MTDDGLESRSELATLLAGAAAPRRVLPWAAGAAVLLVVGGVWLWRSGNDDRPPAWTTVPIVRGPLTVTVTATGTLEPTNQVEVGSELSGTIARVRVDTNDRVRRGQVLAELDTRKLGQQTERTRATLRAAEARVSLARATLTEADANLRRLDGLFAKSGGTLPSAADLDAARAAEARARADLDGAKAAVAEADAALRANENDLAKGAIRAPIDGVVLTRTVEPGQTVAASFQAPVLFTLAEDLRRMTLKVDVAEADVAQVSAGQAATFTVDAWPGRRFDARVTKVQYGSKVIDNVVSYPTELAVANDDLGLRPGMTATADLRVADRRDVLLVPNAALRFVPASGAAERRRGFSLVPQMPRRQTAQRNGAGADGTRQLWILREGRPQPLAVRAGPSDGRLTEVSGDGVRAGLEVITEGSGTTP
jgi:HlyD family secretion protein